MRSNTQKIFDKLSRGEFIPADSIETETRRLYEDIEENYEDYLDYFSEIGFYLERGRGYYYFCRSGETKANIEQKLESFSKWIDYLDFLKTYTSVFSAGFQFRKSEIVERIISATDYELKDKANKLFRKNNYSEIVDQLVKELVNIGFAELVNEQDETYKVTSAFNYAEDMVSLLTIYNEDEIPE